MIFSLRDLLYYKHEFVYKKRARTVTQAIANEKLEGLEVSPETRRIADSYVAGKAPAKAVAAKIRARYGML